MSKKIKKIKRRRRGGGRTSQPAAQEAQGPQKACEALELRKLGLSYREIGARLGVSHQAAHQRVQRSLEQLRAEATEAAQEVRDLELERLDLLVRRALELVQDGDPKVAARGIEVAIKASASRRDLLGLDAPQRREITGKDGAPLEVRQDLDLSLCTKEELEALKILARLRARLGSDQG